MDAVSYKRALVRHGIPADVADAHAEALGDLLRDGYFTKSEIENTAWRVGATLAAVVVAANALMLSSFGFLLGRLG